MRVRRGVVIGIGTRAGVGPDEVLQAITEVMHENWSVVSIASIDRKAELVAAIASRMGVRGATFSASDLSAVVTESGSDRVRDAVGTASVAEASALLAGSARRLLVPKAVGATVVVAVAATDEEPADLPH
ncbi:MAG: cobalamin biosynthesis protein [Rhodococcus sp.]|uniref:cobalamin biosynthesis protein n=1 Tax=Nocardiaceae TaxID=85025 RepID=UPI00068A3216|nr:MULTISPECIES: cobalamin biosynthesis protein [Rhodococcus]MBY4205261.1 cobalamin biosynthesis protein [Rhodococcus fascians]MBY4227420.1 cobalamin biosynthesis protein [Rhodococcus fascians]MCX6491990.1 cobalamin biosynthesis protein [Rhodococcus sp. (in: high G+C Gram-positive bacteria)]